MREDRERITAFKPSALRIKLRARHLKFFHFEEEKNLTNQIACIPTIHRIEMYSL